MDIAIIGAGMAGLASAWHLAKQEKHAITVFDKEGIGQGASGVAAGLLHPDAGAHAKRNWHADEGMRATLALIEAVQPYTSKPLIINRGLLRFAVSDAQKRDFFRCAEKEEDVDWLLRPDERYPSLPFCAHPAIFIRDAITVDCPTYLDALWSACQAHGVAFEKRQISSLQDLSGFDRIVIAMGASSHTLQETASLPITPIKGQVLECSLPVEAAPLPFSISSQTYLIPQKGCSAIVGATFERHFVSEAPNLEKALGEIIPKTQAFYPLIGEGNVLSCRAGVRASAPHHRPLLQQLAGGWWVLTGLGSKGLLYHALYAETLARNIENNLI